VAARGLRVATLAAVGSGRGWLGEVIARQAAGSSGRCTSTGGLLVIIMIINSEKMTVMVNKMLSGGYD